MYVFIFSGESAFRTLSIGVGFSKHPMVHRISDINPNIPVNVLYGSESWMAKFFDLNSLSRENGYLDVQTIENAGFNQIRHIIINKNVLTKSDLNSNVHKII